MEALRRAAFIVLLRFVSDDYPLLRLEVIWIIISRIALIRVKFLRGGHLRIISRAIDKNLNAKVTSGSNFSLLELMAFLEEQRFFNTQSSSSNNNSSRPQSISLGIRPNTINSSSKTAQSRFSTNEPIQPASPSFSDLQGDRTSLKLSSNIFENVKESFDVKYESQIFFIYYCCIMVRKRISFVHMSIMYECMNIETKKR
ncbi:unnamed protein product [Dracunculus medinensis]|uniref:Uncharacterized protein n=1 Tax=Dracunculus medinensis TaxID=318479 RepID=A0A0N4UAZ3_DRAME|nr:unnamed protein product [Dracunculus medinensis]